ncbi:MAG: S1C family serine protease, partial [Candidatus Sumerlaeota bacterium]
VLEGGAMIRAEVLKQTDDRVVVDLGFQSLDVPAGVVQSVLEAGAAVVAPLESTGPEEDGEGQPRGEFGEIVSDLEDAVVLVSNAGGFGAGFIVDETGLVLTNRHVVKGERFNDVTLFVMKENGQREKRVFRRAEVKGYSSLMDCALLQIPPEQMQGEDLPTVDLAPPGILKTGIRVYAIGNPGVGAKVLRHTVSQGIVSSTNRNFNDILYVQTTAAVNPGNSGGPLFDHYGRVVGLVTFRAIWQEGLAFALPAWYLRHFVDHIEAYAPTAESESTGYRYHDPMAGIQ